MPPSLFNTRRVALMKRALFKASLGGIENNPQVHGDGNQINFHGSPKEKETTFVHQTFTEAGKLLKAGTNLITAPVKWIEHMQENWLTYLVCITILMVCVIIIYCCIRRKMSHINPSSFASANMSRMIMDEAMKLATLRHTIRDN